MSSSFITATTDTTTTRLDSNYVIASFLPSVVYPTTTSSRLKYAKMGGSVLTSTPTVDSQSNFMTYDSLPVQHTTPTGGIPLENLSIQNSNTNSNEWISGLNYSAEYSSHDMNFLFAYNDLVVTNKDMANSHIATHSTPSESSAMPVNDDIGSRDLFHQVVTAAPLKITTEQPRRYSMMDMTSRNQQYSYTTTSTSSSTAAQQHGQWMDSLFYQQPTSNTNSNTSTADNMIHKERSSMPNLFIGQSNIIPTDSFSNEQNDFSATTAAVATNSFSWQQQHDSLQKKPMSSESSSLSTPIKEKEQDMMLYDGLTKYNFNIPTTSNTFMTPSTSVSSPLKQHLKKRSIVDEILHEEETDTEYTVIPSVESSLSEPIPTSTWINQPVSRKRTKSSMRDSSSKDPSNLMANGAHERMVESHENYHQLTNEILPPNNTTPTTTSSHDYNSGPNGSTTHVLTAMPRRQKLRYDGDYYTPKWVRYTGHLKEGYCDSCNPGKWLQLKNSAYWYHKQFYHGISSVSGKLFIKPVEQRMGKGDVIEGLCHQCHRYVPACNGKKKNNYMLWYRHAHKCHLYDKPKNTTKASARKLSITSLSTSPVHTPSSSITTSATTATTNASYIS